MPFVHVIDGGLLPSSFQRAQAADTQHDFLTDARVVSPP